MRNMQMVIHEKTFAHAVEEARKEGYKLGRIEASEDLNKLDGWNTGCPCNCGKTKYVLCKEEAIYAARNGVIN